jgi:hypothetical protein
MYHMEPQSLAMSTCPEIHKYLTHIPKHVCTLPQTTLHILIYNYPLRNAIKLKYKLRLCVAVTVFYNDEEHQLKEDAYFFKQPLSSVQLVAQTSLPHSKLTQA